MTNQAKAPASSADTIVNQARALIASLEMDRAEYLAQTVGYPYRKENLRRTNKALLEARAIVAKYAR